MIDKRLLKIVKSFPFLFLTGWGWFWVLTWCILVVRS